MDPLLEPIVLVAAFWRPAEDRVVAHRELGPAGPGRIVLVDSPVVPSPPLARITGQYDHAVMSKLDVAPIGALSQKQLGQVRAIYEEAFPPALRVPFAELIQIGDLDQMFVAVDGPAPVGFASLRLLPTASWSFLRYFAIAAARRGQGTGRQFWQLLQASVGAVGWPARIVFEAEDPDEAAGDAAERLVRQRRVRFWTGCGAQLLPVPGYVLPDYTGCGITEPILLMASDPGTNSPCSGDELRSAVLAIYTDRYGLISSDTLVTEALASITR